MSSGDFYAMLFRMKHINRWGLMRNTYNEDLSQHSFETAVIAHALALISRKHFNKNADPNKLITAALYHDIGELLTGDLPTPVKYHNTDITRAYKEIERLSNEKLYSLLEDDIRKEYESCTMLNADEEKLLKAADRICALIKCKKELMSNNPEFRSAHSSVEKSIKEMNCKEADYFMEELLPSFEKDLDQITL